jgi:hypothetical protein
LGESYILTLSERELKMIIWNLWQCFDDTGDKETKSIIEKLENYISDENIKKRYL